MELFAVLMDHGGFELGNRRVDYLYSDVGDMAYGEPATLLEWAVLVNNEEAFEILMQCFGWPTADRDNNRLLRLLTERAAGQLDGAVDQISRDFWCNWRDRCVSRVPGFPLTNTDVVYLCDRNVPRKVKALLLAALSGCRRREAGSEPAALVRYAMMDAVQLVNAQWFTSPGASAPGCEASEATTSMVEEAKTDEAGSSSALVEEDEAIGSAKRKARTH